MIMYQIDRWRKRNSSKIKISLSDTRVHISVIYGIKDTTNRIREGEESILVSVASLSIIRIIFLMSFSTFPIFL